MINFLFDCSGSEKSVNLDVAVLTDPPGSFATLHVRTRVPIRIENDNPEKERIILQFIDCKSEFSNL